MFIWLAARATARAHRTQTVRDLKRAWFWRSLASWLRGGEWSPFDLGIELPKRTHPDQASRRKQPKSYPHLEAGRV